MKKIIVEPDFWRLFPEGEIHFLTLKDINNQVVPEKKPAFQQQLQAAAAAARESLTAAVFSENEVVAEWRQAFRQFKTKKGARSSVEALMKRAWQEREFQPINPLVDLYNSVSLQYQVPCGGEDVDKLAGDLHLGLAKGGEAFKPLGADEDAPALAGELAYYDEAGAVCRCFNWREAQRTMLTEETTMAVLVVESVNQRQRQQAAKAMEALQRLADEYFGIESAIYSLTAEHPSGTLG